MRRLTASLTLALAMLALSICAPTATARIPDDVRLVGHFNFSRVVCVETDTECIIREVWPDELEDRAVSIVFGRLRYPNAQCRTGESRGEMIHRIRRGKVTHAGLFQISVQWRKPLAAEGIAWDDVLNDPWANARAGLWVYEATEHEKGRYAGWWGWDCARKRAWGRSGGGAP